MRKYLIYDLNFFTGRFLVNVNIVVEKEDFGGKCFKLIVIFRGLCGLFLRIKVKFDFNLFRNLVKFFFFFGNLCVL